MIRVTRFIKDKRFVVETTNTGSVRYAKIKHEHPDILMMEIGLHVKNFSVSCTSDGVFPEPHIPELCLGQDVEGEHDITLTFPSMRLRHLHHAWCSAYTLTVVFAEP